MKKEWRLRLKFVEEWLIFLLSPPLIFLIKIIPLSWVYLIGRTLALLGRIGLGRREKIALANLRLVFGDQKDKKALRILYHDFLNMTTINFLEIVKYALLPSGVVRERIEIVGKGTLKEAVKKGKGAIALSIHLGNFALIGPRLALEGYPFAYILKYPKNRYLTRLFERYRDAVGINFIDGGQRRPAVQGALQLLRQGGILCILLDQNPPYDEIMVDFFGYPVPSFKGPVVLAMRTGASILPTFIVSGENRKHTIIIGKPFQLEITGDNDRDISHNLALLMKLTENYIVRYPEQWWWWHRRWKKHIDYKQL